jgi:hypothetical protein
VLLSNIERACSDIADTYIGPLSKHAIYVDGGSRHSESHRHIRPASSRSFSEDSSRSVETLKLYAVNCESTHIIPNGPKIAMMLRDAEEQQSTWVSKPVMTILAFVPALFISSETQNLFPHIPFK